jgi:hypothetical protein
MSLTVISTAVTRPFKTLSFTLTGYLLSFVSIRTSLIFKSTCRSHYNISRLDVSIVLPAKEFIHLSKLKHYCNWSGDKVKKIACREYPDFLFSRSYGTVNPDGSIGGPFESLNYCQKQKIKSLKMDNVGLYDINAIQLRKIATLKVLHLGTDCHITDAGLKELSELSLHSFSLMNAAHITAMGLNYLSKMPLQYLTLERCKTSFKREALKCLKQMPLEELHLGNGIKELDIDWLAKDMPALKKLNGQTIRKGVEAINNHHISITSSSDIVLFTEQHIIPESRTTYTIPLEMPSRGSNGHCSCLRTICVFIADTFAYLAEWFGHIFSNTNR